MGRAEAIKRTITRPTTPIAKFSATLASCPSDFSLMVTVTLSPDALTAIFAVSRCNVKRPNVHVPPCRKSTGIDPDNLALDRIQFHKLRSVAMVRAAGHTRVQGY